MDEPAKHYGPSAARFRLTASGLLKASLLVNYVLLWFAYFWVKSFPDWLPVPDFIGLVAHDTPERYGSVPMAVDCIWPVPLLNLQFVLYWVWLGLMGLIAWRRRRDPSPDIPLPTIALAIIAMASPEIFWLVWKGFYLPDCWNYLLFPACRGPVYIIIGPPTLFLQLAATYLVGVSLRELYSRFSKEKSPST